MNPYLEPQYSQIDVVHVLKRYLDVPGMVSIGVLAGKDNFRFQNFETNKSGLTAALAYVEANQQHQGVYIRASSVREGVKGRGKSTDSVSWPVLYLGDCDYGKPGYAPDSATVHEILDGLESDGSIPALTERHDSGHGDYPVLVFDRNVPDGPDVEALRTRLHAVISARFTEHGYKLDSVGDGARVWRIPGTVNRKDPAAPVLAKVERNGGPVYSPAQIAAVVPPGGAVEPRTAVGGSAAAEETYTTPERRASDTAEALAELSELLRSAAPEWATGQGAGNRPRRGDIYWKLAALDALPSVDVVWAAHGLEIDPAERSLIDGARRQKQPNPVAEQLNVWGDPVDPRAQGTADANAPEATTDPFELGVTKELYQLRVKDEARRRLNNEKRKHRPSIESGVIDNLDLIEEPTMALGSLIPDESIGFVAGRSGAYKTFLSVSWACCLATGTSWLDDTRFIVRRPLKTLYVAAEGSKGAAARIRAWEARTGISRRGKLQLYPRPIHLNDQSHVDELAEFIEANKYEFLVIDTYHRSAPGTEENSSTDFGVIFEAVARLRDVYGCSTLFVDHTGHAGERNRGTSAKGDDADYILISSYDGENRGPEVQRSLEVRKLKDEETSGKWPIRLAEVGTNSVLGDPPFPVVEIGEVEKPPSDGPLSLIPGDEGWTREAPDMPHELLQRLINSSDRNRGVKLAEWVWRLLKWANDPDGMTRADIKHALKEMNGNKPPSSSALTDAYATLKRSGLATEFRSRFTLASEYGS